MTHEDSRIPLTACSRPGLRLGEAEFELNRELPVGRGGTCLVYHALQKDSRGLGRRVILKEFYPALPDSGQWRDPATGALALPEDTGHRRERFLNSYENFKAFFNEEELNLYTVQAQGYLRGNGTDYMVVDYSSGQTLRDYMEDGCSLFGFFGRMKVVAQVVEKIHSRGYVHMDLKPENLLCYAAHDVVKMLDTDSLLEKAIFSGEAREITLSGSGDYTAPEVLELLEGLEEDWLSCREERLAFAEIGHRADLFSFGRILQEFLWKGQPPETPVEDCLRQREPYLSGKAVNLVKCLLEKTLAEDPEARFASMEALAQVLEPLLPLLDPGKPQLAQHFVRNSGPVLGREEKLARMEELLAAQKGSRSRIEVLCGMGGVGKSVLARRFAQEHEAEYDVITEVSAASAAEAVRRLTILGWEPEEGPGHTDACKKMVARLCKDQKVLILVHDYDVSDDPDFGIWRELGCDVILTSRHDWHSSGIPTVGLACADLSQEQAEEIFIRYYLEGIPAERAGALEARLQKEGAALGKLVSRMDRHPLALRLLARYMTGIPGREQGPEKNLEKMEETVFSRNSPRAFQNSRDDAMSRGNVYSHLAGIFRHALDSKRFGPEEIQTLRHLLLIPSGIGISPERFEDWFKLSADWLEGLRQQGWLENLPGQQDPLSAEALSGVYILPKVLQEILKTEPELAVSMSDAEDYSDRLYSLFHENHDYLPRQALLTHMEQLLTLPEEDTEVYLWMLISLWGVYSVLARMEEVTDIGGRILELYNRLPAAIRGKKELAHNVRQIRRADLSIRGTWDTVDDLMDQNAEASVMERVQDLFYLFEYGKQNEAVALAKKLWNRDWNREELADQITFWAVLTRILCLTGFLPLAKTTERNLSTLYWAKAHRENNGGLDPMFFLAVCEYVPMQLRRGCTEKYRTYISQLHEAALHKLGPNNGYTAMLGDFLAQAHGMRGDFAAAAACREEALPNLWANLDHLGCGLHLALDYEKTDSEKAKLQHQRALEAYNRYLEENYEDWQLESIDELPQFYYVLAVTALKNKMVSSCLTVLEAWLRLAIRLYGPGRETAVQYAAAREVLTRLGLEEKAALYQQEVDRNSPARDQALNRYRPGSPWLKKQIDRSIGTVYDILLELAEQNKFHRPIW